jgi:hypothetical protein
MCATRHSRSWRHPIHSLAVVHACIVLTDERLYVCHVIDAQLANMVAGFELLAGFNELTAQALYSLRSLLCLRNILMVR